MARKSKGAKKGGLVSLAMRTGINRGVFGDSKGWLYVGLGLGTLRVVRKLAAGKPEILLREEIKPGERLIIANDRVTLDSLVGAAAEGTRRGRKG